MKQVHVPQVDARYWTAILLASVFGTNMGDFYAHESGFGIGLGLTLLALLAALVFAVEHFDHRAHDVYYWLVILLIRTGATNIADTLAYRVRIPALPLIIGLAALIALFGWRTHSARRTGALPATGAAYWMAMLSAGVFGTVLGDVCEHIFGEGVAALLLTAILLLDLFVGYRRALQFVAVYWSIVAVARTTGTALGDWLAENQSLNIGLPRATLLSGIAFTAVIVLWRSGARASGSVLQAESTVAQ